MELRPTDFFALLYPTTTTPDNAWLTLWTRQDKLTRSFPATPEGFQQAEEEALRLDGEGKDVYFGVGLRKEKLPPEKRGAAGDVVALPGLWVDADCQEGIHKAGNLPAKGEALQTLLDLPVPPTVVVDSGGGLHAYWLFREPWAFGGEDDRREAASLSARFQQALQALWREQNWELDNTSDLARILRVPGTRNWKDPGNPREVKVVHLDPGRRYALEELARWAGEVLRREGKGIRAALERANAAAAAPGTDADVEAVVGAVKPWWSEGDRHNRALALAGFLAKRGVPQETVEAIIARLVEETGDSEVKDRLRAVADTYAKLAAGERVTGLSALPQELAEKLDSLVRRPDPVQAILADLGDPPEWPRLFEQSVLRRLAGLREEDFQRFLAEVKARGGAKVVSPGDLKKAVKQARAKVKAERRGLEVLEGGGDPLAGPRTIAEAFPPAKDVLPEGFPFPALEDGYYDIRRDRVVRVELKRKGEEEEEEEEAITDTVVLLTRRITPVEADSGIEKFRVAWWERDRWRFGDVPARYLFDRKRVAELVDLGIPVSSGNVDKLIDWLHRLRCMAVLGHQGAPELPTVHAVNRCGWHELNGEKFFVLGREILRPGGASLPADAGDREEIEADSPRTDTDVRWAEDLSALERQILSGFRCSGDPEEQKKFLLDTAIRYPQVAFGVGCAAGAPLLRFAREAGLLDVNGFTVLMVPRAGGRSRHQGKSTWNMVVASLYGSPARCRNYDATQVAQEIVLGTCCDLTVHREDLQLVGTRGKKDREAELLRLVHQVAKGEGRDRGARSGGGRKTREFFTVLFATAELDVTTWLPTESGAHDRILKLPPLLPEESDENRAESERLQQVAAEHHGHAGREYLAWLVEKVRREGDGFIREGINDALGLLRRNLPGDARRASAGRLASRAAVGLCGLTLLLEAWQVGDETAFAAIKSFLRGWEMAVDAVPAETVADRALEAVQAFVAANRELIQGLRGPDAKNPPPKWIGTLTEVVDDSGQKVRVVALTEPAFAEAVSREPFDLDPHHALQALAAKGYTVTRKEKMTDGKEKVRTKLPVRIAGTVARCICIPFHVFTTGEADGSEGGASPSNPDVDEIPF
ncbi:DUF927 domain-containing protein [Ammonifex thiophilus]|uniref:DUF927 domain-containing protein n=1 Tax=Ammonifex thiophilus TaxID=444093 RepID=A0A3D8P1J2_9THEO|nr:DUF927 domain-containing protein [Ammonifex thiophilus]RDV81691.1 DUF927 domain-containing protein [Ammonifex thiophilus]